MHIFVYRFVYPSHAWDTRGTHVVCSWSVQQMGCFENHFNRHTEPVLTADKNYRIVREEDSASLKSSLIIGLVLVIMLMLISGWNI